MKLLIIIILITIPFFVKGQEKTEIKKLNPRACYLQRGRGANIGRNSVACIIDGVQTPDMLLLLIPKTSFGFNGDALTKFTLDRLCINRLPVNTLQDLVASSPLVYQRKRGYELTVRGGELMYVVDGMVIPPTPKGAFPICYSR